VNEGREEEREVDEDGIQTAAPVPNWLIAPSVKWELLEESGVG